MKKIVISSLAALGLVACQGVFADASADVLNLSGHYVCQGYDIHDKAFSNELVVSLNSQNSRLAAGYGAYMCKVLSNGAVIYESSMVTNGNNYAMTFNNTSTADPTDYGTIIGVATSDLDSKGVAHTMLHSFYYEPAYEGGSNGTATCVKQ